jgi:hypothetical protein
MKLKVNVYKNKVFLIVIITIIFTGCKFLKSAIINNCSSNTKIDIHFEEEFLPFIPGDTNRFYKLIDKSTENNKVERLCLDSVNFIVSYLLNPADTFYIKPAIKHRKDTIYIIRKMSFINNMDTILIDNYDLFEFVFFNDSIKYNPFKIEDYYFRKLDEEKNLY